MAKGVRVVSPGRLQLGRRVALGRDMYVEVPLIVGDDVLFSGQVAVLGNVHPIDTPGTVYATIVGRTGEVVLEGDNLIGYGSILIAPCRVGHGAVVGAGAVVAGDLEPDGIYVGSPARLLRTRRRDA